MYFTYTAPVKQNLNNSILRGVGAMPLKSETSDGTGDFSNMRRLYADTYKTTASQPQQKKWQGGDRSASTVIFSRRVHSAGTSLNPSAGNMCFASKEKNSRIDALARVRGQGSRVPPKVAFSKSNVNRPANFWGHAHGKYPGNTVPAVIRSDKRLTLYEHPNQIIQ